LDPEAGANVGTVDTTLELVGVLVEDDVELGADADLALDGALTNTQSEPWHS